MERRIPIDSKRISDCEAVVCVGVAVGAVRVKVAGRVGCGSRSGKLWQVLKLREAVESTVTWGHWASYVTWQRLEDR